MLVTVEAMIPVEAMVPQASRRRSRRGVGVGVVAEVEAEAEITPSFAAANRGVLELRLMMRRQGSLGALIAESSQKAN